MMLLVLLFTCAFALSGAAAFYAVIGLMAIFAAAPVSIAILGSILEATKLVVASWLYRNWNEVPLLMKGYFTIALLILMFLTSMGIFGFLSKAHLDQAVPSGEVVAQVQLIDEKIKIEKELIHESRKSLAQLDKQVDQTIARTEGDSNERGINRSISIRKSQSKERKQLYEAISTSQSNIAKLTEEKTPLASQLRKIEAEVGPIKYIAAVIYDNAADEAILEKAVRYVTLLLVAVFDPLAVMLLIAANWTLLHIFRKKSITEPNVEEDTSEPDEVWDDFFNEESDESDWQVPEPPSDIISEPTSERPSQPAWHSRPR